MTASSLAALFLDRCAATPDAKAFLYPKGDAFVSMTWREAGDQVRAIAGGLRALGLEDEERCAIISSTRVDWILVDLAIMCAGGATTTVYPSNTPEECAYILNDSNTVIAIAEDAAQVDKLRGRRSELPGLRKVVVIDGASDGDWVLSLSDLMQMGRAADPARIEAIARAVRPDQLATLVYTSGTTGRPKGVELTHDAWVYTTQAVDELKLLGPDDVQYLWLPLSHVFGKVLEGVQLRVGFPTAIDGRIDRLVENLGKVKPTFVAAVPRIFEKVHNKVVSGAQEKGGLALKIFRWAFAVGTEHSKLVQAGKPVGALLAFKYKIAERLVFSKLHKRFGGRLRFFISGSAPLSREIADFFHAAGILICEGYGLTETSAASFVNLPQHYKLGTVGPPLPGTEVRIASDGEVCLRSRGVMRGYHGKPDATGEVLKDGWLMTGDIGEVDPEGFLRITDRKKDLIKTSGGKYVAPQALEGRLKAISPYVSQVVVHGNNRNFCTALVTLDQEAVRAWATQHGLGEVEWPELAQRDEVRTLVDAAIKELNRSLASYESIKKFAILPHDLTQESGELTASLKVKRKVVEDRYRPLLDSFYAGATASL